MVKYGWIVSSSQVVWQFTGIIAPADCFDCFDVNNWSKSSQSNPLYHSQQSLLWMNIIYPAQYCTVSFLSSGMLQLSQIKPGWNSLSIFANMHQLISTVKNAIDLKLNCPVISYVSVLFDLVVLCLEGIKMKYKWKGSGFWNKAKSL